MNLLRTAMRTLSVASIVLLIAACGQQDSTTPPVATALSPAATAVAPAAIGANSFNAQTSDTNPTALPADCETYLMKIEACVAKLGVQSETGRQLKEGADEARREWAKSEDRTSVGQMCRQAVVDFAQGATEVGCS
ncbi:hypothetical protein G3N59_31830 [Paraburkholderia sp. Ac-20340]|uniref:hypothetical protein n=1 Tax=Paraburkholderia sp. Ac-20340 TaxID=2703888 RepID=UPI00197F9B88|nr:hypothetical protein [Paraburkholderia sp. Ac-20340]MBN3857985.1 hypothetical protein [Paraburkholderia sp. Ac-20340]